jgi:very-short-patch-repair endonuclease
MDFSTLLIIVVLVVGLGAWLLRAAGGGKRQSPFVAKPLLTRHETAFFMKLTDAAQRVGAAGVFPQVAMGALLDARKGLESKEFRQTRNRFDRKIVDFVVVDDKMEVMAIVELDDWSHKAEKDQARDAMTAAAGYKTARFRDGHKISVTEIEQGLRQTIRAAA